MIKWIAILLLLCVATVVAADETANTLSSRLKSIGPTECLRVYRVRILSSRCEYAPRGFINTRHTAVLEAAYGSVPPESREVQFLTYGGRIGDLWESHSQAAHLEPDRSYVLGLIEVDEPGYGLMLRDHQIVGYASGDTIRFPWLGACVDSTGLCRIVLDL